MKALFIYCKEFSYTPTIKTVDNADEVIASYQFENVQVAFIQAEYVDIERENDVITKLVKNLKWICGKNKVKKVILHSFAHLSESKADPNFTKLLFSRVEERMRNVGYEVFQTPFGYFLDLQIDAPGFSLARVFKNI
ncbi:MAG TPA: threonyl-tRNA synthetase editing domain-containing protein [Bacteroidales bacterium]|nr:threonyl-tRNA synthetase editing domain-containing protein [Bacteroidales bacterium]